MKLYCGIDLHSNNAVYAVKNEEGRVLLKKRLPNDMDAVLRTLAPFKPQLEAVTVESTYNWYWLVDGLQDNGYPMRLANPAAIKQYDGLKSADDGTDALHLAELLRLNILPQGYIYPRAERSLRDLLRRRMLLVQLRTSVLLSVENMFARETGRHYGWREIGAADQGAMSGILGNDEYLLFTAREQSGLVKLLTEKIHLFEKKALESAKLRTEFELLKTMPGVGMILGLVIMLETGDIKRFRKAGNFTSYCRCTPATHTSNNKLKTKNNKKCGNLYLAWAFTEAVHHAIGTCPQANAFYQRKKAMTGSAAVATKALASKWAKAAWHMLTDQQPFDLRRVFG